MMTDFQLPAKEVFSIREVAALLGVSRSTVNDACRSGRIHTIQVPRGVLGSDKTTTNIPRSEVERLARQKGLM